MCLVSDAMAGGMVNRFSDMRLPTQLELHKLYSEVQKVDRFDKSAEQYVGILEQANIGPLIHGADLLLPESAMRRKNSRKRHALGEPPDGVKSIGDELFEYYARNAAAVAGRMNETIGRRAFLLGLGVGLDRTSALNEHRSIGPLIDRVESKENRRARIRSLGVPTVHGKHEMARHFVLAAALTGIVGAPAAEHACLAIQLGKSDSQKEFSVAAYQADLAGIAFGYRVLVGNVSLQELASNFSAAQYVPDINEPESSISAADFAARYGSCTRSTFSQAAICTGTEDSRSQYRKWFELAGRCAWCEHVLEPLGRWHTVRPEFLGAILCVICK